MALPTLLLGDIGGTQEGLRASIIAVQRAAVMGYPNWGSDTCGYNQQLMEQEVCGRWLEFSAFTPIMEVGPTRNVAFWNAPRPHLSKTELYDIGAYEFGATGAAHAGLDLSSFPYKVPPFKLRFKRSKIYVSAIPVWAIGFIIGFVGAIMGIGVATANELPQLSLSGAYGGSCFGRNGGDRVRSTKAVSVVELIAAW